jgi:hypothetical protein
MYLIEEAFEGAIEKAIMYTTVVISPNHPHSIHVTGENIFDVFDEVFDEIDELLRMYLIRGLPSPIIIINASRQWYSSPPRFDTVPDECIESFCQGIPYNKIEMDFSDVFK